MFNVCHSERSRGISRNSLNKISRAAFLLAILASVAFAQESPTPIPAPTVEESLSPSISPEEALTPGPAPAQTPSQSPARSVRISFVPPPLEGTISLGIYDGNGKLVRILHQQADLNEFTIGADALVTKWDGKNDDGEDLPAGKYHARGYVVARSKIEDLGQAAAPAVKDNASGN